MHFAAGRGVEASSGPGEQVRERLLMASELIPKSVGKVGAAAAEIARATFLVRSDLNLDQLLWIRNRQSTQAHRVQKVENRGVGADSERQAQNRDDEEPAFQPEQAGGVAKILRDGFEKSDSVHTMPRFLGERDIAELPLRGPGGLLGVHAPRDILVDFVPQMRFHFQREIFVAPPSPEISEPTHASLRRWAQHTGNGADDLIPAAPLLGQILPTSRRNAVVLRFAVVLGRPPERRDQPAFLQTVQRRVQRAVLHLENVFRSALDRRRDGMAVRRRQQNGPQNKHIQGSLHHFNPVVVLFAAGHVL
jgi:hypothetical protein